MAEVIKYGIISDSDLFQLLEERNLNDFTGNDREEIIIRCVKTKARYVEQDEEDRRGIRAALNLGHTLGHAVETLTNHSFNHGEAVSVGMVAAAWISKEKGYLSKQSFDKINKILKDYSLPTKIPKLNKSKIIEVMHRDKKAEAGQIRFVLPTGIGKKPLLKYVSDKILTQMLEVITI
jgi:3-dehydroquinate synthase